MKKLGLIGGTSPESTVDYYDKINHSVNSYLGRHHSAKILMVSVDFEEIVDAIFSNRWDIVFDIMKDAALTLQTAGVDVVAMCSNTLHKIYPEVKACVDIPFLHILDPVIDLIKKENMAKIAVIGTTFTMEGDFYPSYFKNYSDIRLVCPPKPDREIINDIIFNSLCKGGWTEKNVADILRIVENLMTTEKPDAVLLGCTELSHFFQEIGGSSHRLIDTTDLHSKKLADYILKY